MMKQFFPAPEFEATSNQVCGLWPFAAGGQLPTVGVPIGIHETLHRPVCVDPVNWFIHSEIRSPTAFVLGLPALGKSSLIRHMVTLLRAQGVVPMVLSDVRPDYVALGKMLGCATPKVGVAHHAINPLDPGPISKILPKLSGSARTSAIEQFSNQRLETFTGLLELSKGGPLAVHERNVLQRTLAVLDPQLDHEILVTDVIRFIESRPEELQQNLRSQDARHYDLRVSDLLDLLQLLCEGGQFGSAFCRPTSVSIDPSQGVVFDISASTDASELVQAALQLVTWAHGISMVAASKIEGEHITGVERTFCIVADEMWRMLRVSPQMAHRIDSILRLVRTLKLPLILCTHSLKDLKLADDAASSIAEGLVEKCELKIIGGVTPTEVDRLSQICDFTTRERDMVVAYGVNAKDRDAQGRSLAPGLGKFLIKGGGHSIPVRVRLPKLNREIHDTNALWDEERVRAGIL